MLSSAEVLRDEAYRLAEECPQRAARPGATPIDREAAEAATLLIALSERKAKVVPASWADARTQGFKDWCRQRLRALDDKKLKALRSRSNTTHHVVVETLRDVRNEEVTLSELLKQHEWEVWSWARDELMALNVGLTVDSGLHGEG